MARKTAPLVHTDDWNRAQRAVGEVLRRLRKTPIEQRPSLVTLLKNVSQHLETGETTTKECAELVAALYIHMTFRPYVMTPAESEGIPGRISLSDFDIVN